MSDTLSLTDALVDSLYFLFFFNDAASTEIYTLSLHDALPIYSFPASLVARAASESAGGNPVLFQGYYFHVLATDRKSTRLNSSHVAISYAVFCLKKKKRPWRCDDTPTPLRDTFRQNGGMALVA